MPAIGGQFWAIAKAFRRDLSLPMLVVHPHAAIERADGSNNGVSIRCYRQTVFLGQASRQLLRRSVGESLLPNVIAVRTSIRTEVHPLSIGRPRRVVAAAFRWTNQAHGPVA